MSAVHQRLIYIFSNLLFYDHSPDHTTTLNSQPTAAEREQEKECALTCRRNKQTKDLPLTLTRYYPKLPLALPKSSLQNHSPPGDHNGLLRATKKTVKPARTLKGQQFGPTAAPFPFTTPHLFCPYAHT